MSKSEFYPLLLLKCVVIGGLVRLSFANALPTAVALGGAIVAAIEEDEAEQQAYEEQSLQRQQQTQLNFENLLNENQFDNFLQWSNISAAETSDKIDEGRGKFHKKHKILKHLYPLLIGTILAKTVLVPLILKVLTAISASSFIMAKIALAASGLLALKWILADSGKERTHFEIVHLPPRSSGGGGVGGGSLGYNTIDWSDLSWSGSNYVDVKTTPKQRFKYIPLKGGSSSSSSSGSDSIVLKSTYPSNKATGNLNGFKYNYDTNLDGKPFL